MITAVARTTATATFIAVVAPSRWADSSGSTQFATAAMMIVSTASHDASVVMLWCMHPDYRRNRIADKTGLPTGRRSWASAYGTYRFVSTLRCRLSTMICKVPLS